MPITHPGSTLLNQIEEIREKVQAIAKGTLQLLKDSNPIILNRCDICNGHLYDGNACVDLSRVVEDHQPKGDRREITVVDSDLLATFCADCGNRFAYAENWRRQLGGLLPLEHLAKSTLDETCDCCLDPLEERGARVNVQVMISQMQYTEGTSDDTTLYPIHVATALAFCADCGNKMSNIRLREAVDQLLRPEDGEENDSMDDDEEDDAEEVDEDEAEAITGQRMKRWLEMGVTKNPSE